MNLRAIIVSKLRAGCIAVVLGSIASAPAANSTIVSWNNLGMHCMDSDYSVFSILPPYNTIEAQLIVGGLLVTNGSGYTVTYEAMVDPAGSFNSTSARKGNFYQFALPIFGANLAIDSGLAGWSMPGTNNTPQAFVFERTNFPAPGATPLVNWFRAEGIPIMPYDDAMVKNPYPMMRIVARDAANQIIASNSIVLPVSDEMDCRACHASGSYTNALPAAGWIQDSNPERDYRLNILQLHDDRQFALYPSLYAQALAERGLNASGLFATVASNGTPVLCASCHASAALGTSGFTNTLPLTQAMHSHHASVPDPLSGTTLNDSLDRSACYRCHPGSTTRCLRGAMGAAVAADGSMAMQCQSCHGTMSQVGAINRIGWLMEPQCQSCHTGTATHNNGQIRYTTVFDSGTTVRAAVDSTFATQPDTPAPGLSLYRFSAGHGGLQCEACHGSTHAEFPTTHTNDNVRNIQLQGHAGVLVECVSCHTSMPDTVAGGPHGLHQLGQDWVNRHPGLMEGGTVTPTQCQACHGLDYRGTVLSKAQGARQLTASIENGSFTVQLFRGAIIGCYTCHNGPGDDSQNTSPAPVVSDVITNTAVGVPVAITLPVAGANAVLSIISQPSHGTVGLVNGVATYSPDPGYLGIDSFTFAAYDGAKNSNVGTGRIGVGMIIETNPPVVRITSPTSNPTSGTTNALLAIGGTATDNVPVAGITWSNNRGGSGAASGTTNWMAGDIVLQNGVNVITVTAIDLAGNVGADTLTVMYAGSNSLIVTTNGSGSISPVISSQHLQIGRSYTLTAKPAPGWVFAGWTGSIAANTPAITFVFSGAMVLEANFVPNPFNPVKGVYNGLFHETTGMWQQSSGFASLTVGSLGSFSGKLQIGSARYRLLGQFNGNGTAHVSIPRANMNPLSVDLQIDLTQGTDQITGTIQDTGWTADLVADRAVYDGKSSLAPQRGQYTMTIAAGDDAGTEPGGISWGIVSIDPAGVIRLKGMLADGTPIAEQTTVSKNGTWPLYVAIYSSQGSVVSAITVGPMPSGDLSGLCTWSKPANPAAKFYPAGFTMISEVGGSRYVPPAPANRVMNVTNAMLVLTGGGFGAGFTNFVTIGSNNRVTATNKTSVSISIATGTFNGSVLPPGSVKPVTFGGVLVQEWNAGYGYSLGFNRSAKISFLPVP